ncbi:hypothetical protein BASA61_004439 [Batrachochytrium salamandrivorans]|nr:hypothetical protein BASA61_004439 [Batrachochytrium salamandrivorans]KAH9267679.1 hypothetical protein BASA84_000571 [Batrachochytrium salamandrivorans]
MTSTGPSQLVAQEESGPVQTLHPDESMATQLQEENQSHSPSPDSDDRMSCAAPIAADVSVLSVSASVQPPLVEQLPLTPTVALSSHYHSTLNTTASQAIDLHAHPHQLQVEQPNANMAEAPMSAAPVAPTNLADGSVVYSSSELSIPTAPSDVVRRHPGVALVHKVSSNGVQPMLSLGSTANTDDVSHVALSAPTTTTTTTTAAAASASLDAASSIQPSIQASLSPLATVYVAHDTESTVASLGQTNSDVGLLRSGNADWKPDAHSPPGMPQSTDGPQQSSEQLLGQPSEQLLGRLPEQPSVKQKSSLLSWFTSIWTHPSKRPSSTLWSTPAHHTAAAHITSNTNDGAKDNNNIHSGSQSRPNSDSHRRGPHNNLVAWFRHHMPFGRAKGSDRHNSDLSPSQTPRLSFDPIRNPSDPTLSASFGAAPTSTSIPPPNVPSEAISDTSMYFLAMSDRHRRVLKSICSVCDGAQFVSGNIVCPACSSTGRLASTKPKKRWSVFGKGSSPQGQSAGSQAATQGALNYKTCPNLGSEGTPASWRGSIEAPGVALTMACSKKQLDQAYRKKPYMPSATYRTDGYPLQLWSKTYTNRGPLRTEMAASEIFHGQDASVIYTSSRDHPGLPCLYRPYMVSSSSLDPGPVSTWAREVRPYDGTSGDDLHSAAPRPSKPSDTVQNESTRLTNPSSIVENPSQIKLHGQRALRIPSSGLPGSRSDATLFSVATLPPDNSVGLSQRTLLTSTAATSEEGLHTSEGRNQWSFVSKRLSEIFVNLDNDDSFSALASKLVGHTTNSSGSVSAVTQSDLNV